MKIYNYKELSKKEIESLCDRKNLDLTNVFEIVSQIEKNILNQGDRAISELSKKFDGIALDQFVIEESVYLAAKNKVSETLKSAIKTAKKNVGTFHETQKPGKARKIETTPGVFCWRENRAIETVGLYIPGGTAPLFSTLLMSAVPAQIAGCKNIIICTPPNPRPEILYTAQLCGIPASNIFQVGGAQAVLAMAYGTDQIPKVDKIFGPGNQFVTAAKMMVSSHTAIDMPAGPSEVLVIADKAAKASFVAADLLSQAEHGADSQSVLVCNDLEKIKEILNEVTKQLEVLPRKELAQKSIQNSFIIEVENLEAAMNFSNRYAPEHLILNVENLELPTLMGKVVNAGSVFVGSNACESFGDYASGTNHILPTSGFAKSFSGVSVDSFVKKITFQEITNQGLENLGPAVETMAQAEDLEGHKNAITVRLEVLKNN